MLPKIAQVMHRLGRIAEEKVWSRHRKEKRGSLAVRFFLTWPRPLRVVRPWRERPFRDYPCRAERDLPGGIACWATTNGFRLRSRNCSGWPRPSQKECAAAIDYHARQKSREASASHRAIAGRTRLLLRCTTNQPGLPWKGYSRLLPARLCRDPS